MRKTLLILVTGLSLATAAGSANAIGCLSGAAMGAVGGHYVGKGHAFLGAAAGCAVGHHLAKKQAEAKKQAALNAQRQATGTAQ